MRPGCDLFVVVGEPSGDAYAAAIVADLLRQRPGLEIAGMGGSRLADTGVDIEHGIDGLSVMGLFPVLARLGEFAGLLKLMSRIITERAPKVLLTIDYPGFNLRLGRRLRQVRANGLHHIHMVAPQVWAWRPRRAKRIAQTVDELLCFFEFEPPLFRRHGANATFIGHPLVDLVHGDPAARLSRLQPPRLLLAPGSRVKEVEGVLPILDRTVRLLRLVRKQPFEVVISRAPDLPLSLYRKHTDLPVSDRPYRTLVAEAHVGVITSGTATLEAALLGLPHVIAYQGDVISMRMARHLLLTDHVGLPNIIHQKRVVPELLQEELTAERLAERLSMLWAGQARQRQATDLGQTARLLGGGGALSRAADTVLQRLEAASARQISE